VPPPLTTITNPPRDQQHPYCVEAAPLRAA
jgi:hypothetical protein